MKSVKYQRGFMGEGLRDAIAAAVVATAIAMFVFGVGFGWVIWIGIPRWWEQLKPWLHQVTG